MSKQRSKGAGNKHKVGGEGKPGTGTPAEAYKEEQRASQGTQTSAGSRGGRATAGSARNKLGCAGCKPSPVFPLCAKALGYITVHVARASAGALTILWDDLTHQGLGVFSLMTCPGHPQPPVQSGWSGTKAWGREEDTEWPTQLSLSHRNSL